MANLSPIVGGREGVLRCRPQTARARGRVSYLACPARGASRTRGRPPELRCRGGEALRALWLASGLPERTLTVGLSCVDSTDRFPVGGLKWDRYESGSHFTRMHELLRFRVVQYSRYCIRIPCIGLRLGIVCSRDSSSYNSDPVSVSGITRGPTGITRAPPAASHA